MSTYVIDDLDMIKLLTSKDIYNKIILHVDVQNREAKYESDYTLFELTEKADYNQVRLVLFNKSC